MFPDPFTIVCSGLVLAISESVVRLRFARGAALNTLALLPAMPVEVLIHTESRSLISYQVRPLRSQMERAFRER